MSGTGKSTVLEARKTKENLTVDLDYDNWIYFDPCLGEPVTDLGRIRTLFVQNPEKESILAGTAMNQSQLRPFIEPILLQHRECVISTDRALADVIAEIRSYLYTTPTSCSTQ